MTIPCGLDGSTTAADATALSVRLDGRCKNSETHQNHVRTLAAASILNGVVTRQSCALLVIATLALAFGSARCGTCEHPPCPLPTALIVFITSSSGEPIISGSIQATGMTAPMACHFGSQANMCMVLGAAGTYEVSVTAPGYQAATQSFVVGGHDANCGCGTVDTRMVTIPLTAQGTDAGNSSNFVISTSLLRSRRGRSI